jgi:peptidoglycan/xylan/chitin deacetylase (PgdA/CDA1 family)
MLILLLVFAILLIIILILRQRAKKFVPILMYHRIAAVPCDRNSLPQEKFAWQMEYLQRNSYTPLTLAMLLAFYEKKSHLPPKPVLITFDDGYADNFTAALPILKKYNMRGVVFPITNWIGKENGWENLGKAAAATMTIKDLAAWQDAAMEIASHTKDHPFLNTCPPDRQYEELASSKEFLEKNFGKAVDFICYPYGRFDETTVAMAKKAGYKGAFAIFENVPLLSPNIFALPRIPIPSHQKKWEFKLKVSPLFIMFVALRQAERALKRRLKK